jgi:hypothetical protein
MVRKPIAKTDMELVFGTKEGPEIEGVSTPISLTGTVKVKKTGTAKVKQTECPEGRLKFFLDGEWVNFKCVVAPFYDLPKLCASTKIVLGQQEYPQQHLSLMAAVKHLRKEAI